MQARVQGALLFGLFFCVAGHVAVGAEHPSDWDRFMLWDRCRPMDLQVFVDGGASELGLTKEVITRAVRSRLRSAGIYSKDGESELYVGVQVLSVAFQVNIYFRKNLLDPISRQAARAITWQDGNFGTHQHDPQYILFSAHSLVDGFVDEYLRVNGIVCQ